MCKLERKFNRTGIHYFNPVSHYTRKIEFTPVLKQNLIRLIFVQILPDFSQILLILRPNQKFK